MPRKLDGLVNPREMNSSPGVTVNPVLTETSGTLEAEKLDVNSGCDKFVSISVVCHVR